MWDDSEPLSPPTGSRPAERVLVVIMPCQRDWDLVQIQHWYRIPLAHAPSRLYADYLAFYNTSKLEKRWCICQYAPVLGYQLCKRRELLPDEASHPHAEQLYYKIELGSLESLPAPLPSRKLRRITFISTTIERLLSAKDVAELWEHDGHTNQLRRVMSLGEWLWWRYG